MIERSGLGSVTVRYDAGPKTGLPVHFYSRDEVHGLTRERFEPVAELREDVIVRAAPQSGSWAQWEGVWRRR